MPKIHLDQTILQTKTVAKICDYIRHTLNYVDVANEDARRAVLLGQHILDTHEKANEKIMQEMEDLVGAVHFQSGDDFIGTEFFRENITEPLIEDLMKASK